MKKKEEEEPKTLQEKFMKKISNNPQFREAKKSGQAFVMGAPVHQKETNMKEAFVYHREFCRVFEAMGEKPRDDTKRGGFLINKKIKELIAEGKLRATEERGKYAYDRKTTTKQTGEAK